MTADVPAAAAAPRRLPARLGHAFVSAAPVVVAVHAGGLAWSSRGMPGRGWPLAAAVSLVTLVAGALLVRAMRRRHGTWVLLNLLVAAHVLFWCGRGLAHACLRAPSPPRAGPAAAWPEAPQPFLAGVGDGSFVLTDRDTLAGYGATPRRVALPWFADGPLAKASLALMARPAGEGGGPAVPMFRAGTPGSEALGARAVVVRPTAGGPVLAVVRVDLVMCDASVRAEVLRRVADLGVVDETLLLCATHTHSGPGGFSDVCLAQAIATDHLRPDVFERVVSAAVEAVRAAHRNAVPARIGFVRARDRGGDGRPILAQNRSDPDQDRLDTEVLGLRFDAADGSRRIALVLNYAVHPTWGRPRDVVFSRDVAGALERSARIADGATTLFVNGAEGDVKPRIKPDRPDQPTLGAFEDAVARDLAAPATADRLRVVAAVARRDFGAPRYVHTVAGEPSALFGPARGPLGRGWADGLAAAVLLPANALLWSAGLDDVRLIGTFDGAFGAVGALDEYLRTDRFPAGAVRLVTPGGEAVLAWAPGEPTTVVGERIKAEARRRGAPLVYVLGLTNDHMAYVASSSQCGVGTYEGRMTLFGPDTADLLFDTVESAFDAVGLRAPSTGR